MNAALKQTMIELQVFYNLAKKDIHFRIENSVSQEYLRLLERVAMLVQQEIENERTSGLR